MLLDYLKNNLPADTSELWLFSYGYPGQNKSHVMLQFAYTLIHILKIVKVVTHVFPVRGHSHLPCDGDFRYIAVHWKEIVDVPREWDDIIRSARHNTSPFKVVKPAEQGNVFHNMQASLRPRFLPNPKPQLPVKPLRMYRVKDTEPCVILARTSYHGPWNSHQVTARHKVSDLTLIPRHPVPGLKPSKACDVLDPVQYLQNPQNATFFQALAVDSFNGVVADNIGTDSQDNSSGVDE
jgi:hypothetical protein